MGRLGYSHSFFLGLTGLRNRPHMLDNGPHLSHGTFGPWDILRLSVGRFVLGRFAWDILNVHRSYYFIGAPHSRQIVNTLRCLSSPVL